MSFLHGAILSTGVTTMTGATEIDGTDVDQDPLRLDDHVTGGRDLALENEKGSCNSNWLHTPHIVELDVRVSADPTSVVHCALVVLLDIRYLVRNELLCQSTKEGLVEHVSLSYWVAQSYFTFYEEHLWDRLLLGCWWSLLDICYSSEAGSGKVVLIWPLLVPWLSCLLLHYQACKFSYSLVGLN